MPRSIACAKSRSARCPPRPCWWWGSPGRTRLSRPPLRSAPAHQLRYEAARQAKRRASPGGLGAHHAKARLLSNKTHYSPADPEARISVKPGKARALNYLCSLAVDTAQGVITHVQADFADSRDSLHLPGLVEHLQARLRHNELQLRELVADTGYSNGFNYAFLEHRGITPWIPVFGAYKPVIEGFTYQLDRDEYRCRADKPLPFHKYRPTADGVWMKRYRASYADCQACPLKATCVPKVDSKQLVRSAFNGAYRRAWHRQRSRQGQHMRRVWQSPCSATCSSSMVCGGSARKDERQRTKPCCLAPLPTTSKSCSSTCPNEW
nr:hypothetical protein [Hymenobacter profundi]